MANYTFDKIKYGSDIFAISSASTSSAGIVQLSDSTSSSSSTVAATSKAVKAAYDLANGKSTVSVSQTLTSGTEIGSVTVNSVETKLYAPSGGGGGSVDTVSVNGITYSPDTSGNIDIGNLSLVQIVRW